MMVSGKARDARYGSVDGHCSDCVTIYFGGDNADGNEKCIEIEREELLTVHMLKEKKESFSLLYKVNIFYIFFILDF